MSGHTPGPWVIYTHSDFEGTHSSVGRSFGEYHTPQFVADVCGWGLEYDKDPEQQANAKLIAAAPDLLDALRWLVDECEGQIRRGYMSPASLKPARAALAKADGQAGQPAACSAW